MVTLKLLASLREVAGSKELTVPFEPGGTVRDLLRAIDTVNPAVGANIVGEDGELTGTVQVLVGGRNILWLDGLNTVIPPGQHVTLIPPAAGG